MKLAKNLIFILLCVFLLVLGTLPAQAQSSAGDSLPAFPGAEGFGSTTPGGRGGRVIKVTTLETGGPGSLQAACSAEGPRIVVFDTSGVIPGEVTIEHGNITIMGQTAPGAGITIKGMLCDREDSKYIRDIVVRFLRVRPDPKTGSEGDAVKLNFIENSVLDHISCSWAIDECFGLYSARDITVQWCTVEESDTVGHDKGRHNYGLLHGPDGLRFSLHHTLFAHHSRRCPAVANGPADIRNNVVYNFRDGFLHDNQSNNHGFNIIGNYYKRGPSGKHIFPFCFADSISYYCRDNYIEGVGMIQDPWAEADKLYGLRAYKDRGIMAEQECEVPPVTTHDPLEAYELVLETAGCIPRDTVTRRIVEEVRNSAGSWGRHDPDDLMAGLLVRTSPEDSDNDGMPDAWERANEFDPSDGSDHNTVMESGYTAIEEYCNLMARRLIETRGRDFERGDVNCDGMVGFSDLLALIKAVWKRNHTWAADLNVDGRVNRYDLFELWKVLFSSID